MRQSYHKLKMIEQPTPEQVKAARATANLTMTQAAEAALYAGKTDVALKLAWNKVENGHQNMDIAHWAWFLLKTGQYPDFELVKRARKRPILDQTEARVLRLSSGLTLEQAANLAMIKAGFQKWHRVEKGTEPLRNSHWEIFLLRIGKHPHFTLQPK